MSRPDLCPDLGRLPGPRGGARRVQSARGRLGPPAPPGAGSFGGGASAAAPAGGSPEEPARARCPRHGHRPTSATRRDPSRRSGLAIHLARLRHALSRGRRATFGGLGRRPVRQRPWRSVLRHTRGRAHRPPPLPLASPIGRPRRAWRSSPSPGLASRAGTTRAGATPPSPIAHPSTTKGEPTPELHSQAPNRPRKRGNSTLPLPRARGRAMASTRRSRAPPDPPPSGASRACSRAMISGSVPHLPSNLTTPSPSMTQTCVACCATSNPT